MTLAEQSRHVQHLAEQAYQIVTAGTSGEEEECELESEIGDPTT